MDKDLTPDQLTQFFKQTKLLLIVVLATAVVVPLGSSWMVMQSVATKPHASKPGAEAHEEPAVKEMAFYDPMEFLVNLSDMQESHYLRTTISLGAAAEGAVASGGGGHGGGGHGGGKKTSGGVFERLKSQEPMIRDLIISVISSYSMETLASTQGKHELKEQLKTRLQQLLQTEDLAVFFTSFTLQ